MEGESAHLPTRNVSFRGDAVTIVGNGYECRTAVGSDSNHQSAGLTRQGFEGVENEIRNDLQDLVPENLN